MCEFPEFPGCDVTVGHYYYSQLMTTAHVSCHWPAARFTEHWQLGIVAGYRLGCWAVDHAHCSVSVVT